MSDVTLRPFYWGDIPAITAIYRHYVEHSTATFDLEAPGPTYMAEKFGHMVDEGHPVIVAERDGAVVGYAYASTTGRGRPIASPARIRSTCIQMPPALAWARSCSTS